MAHETFRVTFQPEGRSVFVLGGTKLVEAAGQAGIILNQPCGGEGTCGKCRVEITDDAPEPTSTDRRHLNAGQLRDGHRLACQLTVDRDLVVTIPQETRFFEQMVLTEGAEAKYPFDPNVRKVAVTLDEASVEDQRSACDRVKDALCAAGAADCGSDMDVSLSLVRALPSLLADGDGSVTVVQEGTEIQWIERGDTTGRVYGVAFDVGTTTIVATLMDLSTGHSAAVAARTNPQVHFGDDVVTRVTYIQNHADGLERLRKRLMACLNEMVLEVCGAAGIEPESVYEVTAAGNTTMSHIFMGVDPTSIAQAPYVAVFREPLDVRAADVGLEINRNANLHLLPNIAGFVGSDTVAVVLASGMLRSETVQLAIDIGTNGEVVVGDHSRLVACSCAAGPAFEGARIRYGMRASEGAISKVVVNDGIEVNVIGGGRPSGICGSGLIDAVAQLLDVGLIDSTGRIQDPTECECPPTLRDCVVEFDGQPAVVLVGAAESKIREPILLTQRDVREVQLAKAAVQAGVRVAAEEFGTTPEEVSHVLLAGGFGNFIRRSHAKRIGLLPAVNTDRIEFIGNAASTGAKAALVCRSCRDEAERISRTTDYIELATRPDFQTYFMEAMTF